MWLINTVIKLLIMRAIAKMGDKHALILILIFSLLSCSSPNVSLPDDIPGNLESIKNVVSVKVLEYEDFPAQIVSTGVLYFARKAELRFKTSGEVTDIYCVNGEYVEEGDLLAKLDKKEQQMAVRLAIEDLNYAEIELNYLLLGFGGVDGDTNSVNSSLLQSLKIQSGYNRAILNLKKTQIDYQNTFLLAPFSGVVANIKSQPFDMEASSKVFCTLMNNHEYVVEFSLLESEINDVSLNQEVMAIPLAFDSLKLNGYISEINPVVKKNGLVKVKALISNVKKYKLYDGMNMTIILNDFKNNRIVIPKEAIVIRSNRQVVFTYKDGLAKWNYVSVEGENLDNICIKSGLNIGDSVIISGNINLAHDADVIISGYN
jgi:multidrug efflux pump subunit AcrA (membrane-fusion protein)